MRKVYGVLVVLKLSSMLDTKLSYNDPRGSNQIKCILQRPRDISLARLRAQICRVYQTENDVTKISNNLDYKIDESREFSQSTANGIAASLISIHTYG